MPLLPDFKLETHFSKWEFAAKYHMTASDAQSMSLSELLSYATESERAAFQSLHLGYTETFGAPDLRDAIATTYEGLSAHEILCFAGAEEGIYVAMQVLLQKGDHAIVVTPNYQAAETIPLSICDTSGVPLDSADNWTLDIERLATEIRPTTKLVSINFPHNPTGKILEADRYEALIALCRRHNIWLFSDEVYRPLGVSGVPQLRQAVDAYERGLSLGVLSKAYGLPSLRIGWIACRDREILGRMERMKHYLSICNAGPSERLAVIALRNRKKIFERIEQLMRLNLAMLEAFFNRFEDRFEWRRPDGGCVAFPRYCGRDGVEAFTTRLVEEAGVLLIPSSIYRSVLGSTPTDRFRIGYGRTNMASGLAAMTQFLEKNSS
ncbi:MAG: aminotransferase class I/II-fold pyridoxal phosphate-dependent enzyme [Rhodospirillales bacterium]|jgi:aspartate/methionine/tyrosine aminotransferase